MHCLSLPLYKDVHEPQPAAAGGPLFYVPMGSAVFMNKPGEL
jgi:hypothetical protein